MKTLSRLFAFSAVVCALALAYAADDLQSASQDDAQWLMPAKNYAGTRFSGLKQIDTGNVGELQVAWEFSTGVHSWQGDQWRTGGGVVWGWLSYDPAADLVYYGSRRAVGSGRMGRRGGRRQPGSSSPTCAP